MSSVSDGSEGGDRYALPRGTPQESVSGDTAGECLGGHRRRVSQGTLKGSALETMKGSASRNTCGQSSMKPRVSVLTSNSRVTPVSYNLLARYVVGHSSLYLCNCQSLRYRLWGKETVCSFSSHTSTKW